MDISIEESILSKEIFNNLKDYSLIDKFQAYQILDDEWKKISFDVEIIQTEGFEATKKVDPNMVIKKRNGKEEEVQEGWVGHIIPFEIVQENLLADKLESLRKKEARLSNIISQYEEILDSLTEDEKEEITDILNDTNDTFISKEVSKKVKEIKSNKAKIAEGSLEHKIITVNKLQIEEKELKKTIKIEADKLHIETKKTIENLSDEKVRELLKIKWIKPLINNINKLPENLLDSFAQQIQALYYKYNTTFLDIEDEINDSENKLSLLIKELKGNKFDMKGLSEFTTLLKGNE